MMISRHQLIDDALRPLPTEEGTSLSWTDQRAKSPDTAMRRPPVAPQEHRPHHVRLLFPLFIALGLLAYVSDLAASHPGRAQLWSIVQQTWPLVTILIVLYLAARLLVWYRLLSQLGIAVPWRHLAVAFAAGEITKSLPAGIYLQPYLLGRLRHLSRLSLVRSTMATTAMLGLESLLAVPVALLIGLPGAPWVRLTVLGIVLAWLAVLLLVRLLMHYRTTHMSPRTAAWRRRLVLGAEDFLAAGGELVALRTTTALVPTALYMLSYATALYAILQAAGVHGVSFVDTVGLYAVLVLAVILVPIPTEIGLTEFTGLGALLAYGLPGATAASIMLSFRVLTTGATIVVAGALLILMRHELKSTGRTVQGGPGDEAVLKVECSV